MSIRERVGARVAAVRQGLGWSQRELAEKANLAQETVSRLERGFRGVTLENLERLAIAMGVPFSSLVQVDYPEVALLQDAAIRALVEKLRGAEPLATELALRLVETIIDVVGERAKRH